MKSSRHCDSVRHPRTEFRRETGSEPMNARVERIILTENPPGSASFKTATPALTSKVEYLSDPDRWVDDHGDFLFSYAMFHLRDPVKAKDAVQDTLLAALKNPGAFTGKSAERGWLLGILKHKVHDAFRQASREPSFTDLGFFEIEEQQHFVSKGLHRDSWHHNSGPSDWPNGTDESLEREEFWQTFRRCASKLPRNVAQVILMRELDSMETRAICADLNISENNLWVVLHRARMALRRCLETNWFGPTKSSPTSRPPGY